MIIKAKKIYNGIRNEKYKLAVVLFFIFLNIVVFSPVFFGEKFIRTAFFIVAFVTMCVLLIRNYKETDNISRVYLLGINLISLINLIGTDISLFGIIELIIRGIVFLGAVLLELIIVWIAKNKEEKKFLFYLIVSLLAVVINFGGVYQSLYSMYFPYGQEGLKIDQGMEYKQAIMSIDFIYYSADNFFGTDISDVSIKYIDYMKWYEEDAMEAIHIDKYDGAICAIQITKFFALLESTLFLVYISMIIMNAQGQRKD